MHQLGYELLRITVDQAYEVGTFWQISDVVPLAVIVSERLHLLTSQAKHLHHSQLLTCQ